MAETVDVTIPVAPDAALALDRPGVRASMGQLLSSILTSQPGDALLHAMLALKTDAAARGLTQQIIDEELAAYNAERRGPG